MSAVTDVNCSLLNFTEVDLESSGFDNCSTTEQLNPTQLLLIPIFLVSLIGNVCTIALLAMFRKHRVADVLVGGLALTDLIVTLLPMAMTVYSYLTMVDFPQESPECIIHGTVALFTRLSSCMIVTIISIDKCVAICSPFIYKKHATPRVYLLVLCMCWLLNVGVAIVPAFDPGSPIASHEAFCLFDFTSHYAIAIVLIALVQFVIVLVCFLVSTAMLLVNFRSRMKRSGLRKAQKYEEKKVTLQMREEGILERMRKFRRSTLSNLFHVRVEAQLLTMFTVVVMLFYISWLPIVIMILYAQTMGSQDMLSTGIFWGTRFTILSAAINPFVYGLLARRYRRAYSYIVRIVFSACCSCVTVPKQNAFTGEFSTAQRSASTVEEESIGLPEKQSKHRHSPVSNDSGIDSPSATAVQDTILDMPTHSDRQTHITFVMDHVVVSSTPSSS